MDAVIHSQNLSTFLSKYYAKKEDDGQPEIVSHVCMTVPMNGAFNIPADKLPELYELIGKCVKHNIFPGVLERPCPDTSPIKVDIDLKYDADKVAKRQYDDKFIAAVVQLYNQKIAKYLEVGPKGPAAYVFQRQEPYIANGLLKDGIHILYPDIITTYDIQFLIRDEVAKEIEPIIKSIPEPMESSPAKIIDKSVIKSNAWFMYGCTKPNTKPYLLSYILNADGTRQQPETLFNKTSKNALQKLLIKKLSIREHDPINAVKFTPEGDAELVRYTDRRTTIKTHKSMSMVNANVEYIEKLVKILRAKKADDRDSWLNLGMALHNEGPTNPDLLNVWIEFSKQSKKYKDGECEKLWRGFKENREGAITIRSLQYWAKEDNPEEYLRLRKENISDYIDLSSSNAVDGTHHTLAMVLHHMYGDKFVCSGLKDQRWYEFKNHRWQETENGHSLKIKIAGELLVEYMTQVLKCNKAMTAEGVGEDEKKAFEKKAEMYRKIMNKLGDSTFQQNIMKQCADIFYDPEFERKLDDTNRYLIGFENGVYDLKRGEFRDGKPDDYISFSTETNYMPWAKVVAAKKQMAKVAALYEFLNSVFLDDAVRDYVIFCLCSCLDGSAREQKIRILLGDGANGKGRLQKLVNLAFGKYVDTMDVALYTRPHGDPKSASPAVYDKKGVRIVWVEEPNEGATWNTGLLKSHSGGDELSARTLFKAQFRRFYPQFNIFIITNFYPEFKTNDEGMWRRAQLINFPSKFVENPKEPHERKIDLNLDEKLATWKEVFMSMLIEHYPRYRAGGIQLPPAVIKANDDYRKYCDRFQEYLSVTIVKCGRRDATVEVNWLYTTYKTWYKEAFNDAHKIINRSEFIKQLGKKYKKALDIPSGRLFGYTKACEAQQFGDIIAPAAAAAAGECSV